MSEVQDMQDSEVVEQQPVEVEQRQSAETKVEASEAEQSNEESTQQEQKNADDADRSQTETKIPDEIAAKIRETTARKERRKYEAELAEYKRKMEEMSSPPDTESVYDEVIGWRPKNMSVEEYRQRYQEVQIERSAQQEQEAYISTAEQRASALTSKHSDFQPTIYGAVRVGTLTPQMVLAAGQEDNGLEVLYDLTKANSPKLKELASLPEHLQAKEIWKLAWARSVPANPKPTAADEPVQPESEGSLGAISYQDMNFSDGYKEFLKNRAKRRT